MSRNVYDNWERLVVATLRREQLWELFHAHSRTPSVSSTGSDLSFSSPLPGLFFEFSGPSSWYQQNSLRETHIRGYKANELGVEKSPEVRQLVPGDIFVNGKALFSRELAMLQSCRYPPKKLTPGNYWYDRVSGFWGKQGSKPSQIISTQLDIGGRLEQHASNGNTLVFVNGREITRVELRMLKFAGVKCYPDTRLWMYEDGLYEEEGTNFQRGRIWGKVGVKLLCSMLSLPFPPKSSYTSRELSVPDHFEQRAIQKILLTGCRGSGTSTIFKQAIFLYTDQTSLLDEFEHIKLLIQSNLYRYMSILLEGREHFEEETMNESRRNKSADKQGFAGDADARDEKCIYSFSPRMKALSDWLLYIKASSSSDVFSADFIESSAPLLQELWSDPATQQTFNRRRELTMLSTVANYFLECAFDILNPYYCPTPDSILYAEGFPSSPSYLDFSFPPPHNDEDNSWDQPDFTRRYQLIRSMSNGVEHNNNSLEKFEDVQMVVFCISLSDYDESVIDENGASVNKMMHDRKCFESTVTNPLFDQTPFLLLLTKYDLFEQKIADAPLDKCDWFNDFHPFRSFHNDMAEKGFHYISIKFKYLYKALTGGKKLFVAKVACLEQESTDAALRYAREILDWEEEMNEYYFDTDYFSDDSFYSRGR
ncbi:Extra-large guanine nucleotide-binding protein 1 [Sesamum alatum]|uniref:Extra-large guanine nucleotide-binding protein 1 n=1 Tax=Sesamum alatum TaxID=300844 RepID=A0AAE1YAE0_9LAMI|nr:Extra-large guanine nucleotide-binding protein 1 [Sesamum alatum]